jgi:hypothetical protein
MAAAPTLQVLGLKPCTLGDPGEHAQTDLFGVVEGKNEVRPSGARECNAPHVSSGHERSAVTVVVFHLNVPGGLVSQS